MLIAAMTLFSILDLNTCRFRGGAFVTRGALIGSSLIDFHGFNEHQPGDLRPTTNPQ